MQDYKNSGDEEGWDRDQWVSNDLEEDLRGSFGPLVRIEPTSLQVQLFHGSLTGAFSGKPPSELAKVCKPSEEEHAEIAATCLCYLALPEIAIPEPSRLKYTALFKDHPFLKYAAQNWPYHAHVAGGENRKVLKHFRELGALNLNSSFSFQVYLKSTKYSFPYRVPPLVQLSFIGLEELAILLVEEDNDVIHELSGWKQHALHEAAFSGCQHLLELLLRKGVPVDVSDDVNQTALHYAAQGGHADIVQLLIHKGLQVDDPGRYGYTPLHYGAKNNHPTVIEVLIKANADPTKLNIKGDTPLGCCQDIANYDKVRSMLKHAALRWEGETTEESRSKGPHSLDDHYLDVT